MKKINIGIVLIILVLIILFSYSIAKENEKKQDKENVKDALKSYFQVYNKYSLLEKEDRDINKEIDMKKYNVYLEQMRQDLKDYILTDKASDIYNQYKARLDEQVKSKYMLKNYNKDVVQITNYTCKDDYITLNCNINLNVSRIKRKSPVFNKQTGKYIGDTKKQIGQDSVSETIVFKKVDGDYKVVLHLMEDPDTFSFEMQGIADDLIFNN